MVRKFGLLAVSVVLLSGCSFLALSPFPSFLSEAEHSQDLSGKLADGDGDISMKAVRNQNGEYLILVQMPFSGALPRAIIMDSDLNVKAVITDQLVGRVVCVAPDGEFIIGQTVVHTDFTLNIANTPLGSYDAYQNRAISNGTNVYVLYANSSDQLAHDTSTLLMWDPGAGYSIPSIDGSGSPDYYLQTAAADKAAGYGYFVFELYGTLTAVQVPLLSVASLTSPLIASYPAVTVTNVDNGRVSVTREGVVYRDYDDMIRLKDFSGNIVAEQRERGMWNYLETYNVEGTHRYLFDRDKQMVFQAGVWW